MNQFLSFLQALHIKKIKVIPPASQENGSSLILILPLEDADNWLSLTKRLNSVYGKFFLFEQIGAGNQFKLSFPPPHTEQALEILNYAIMKDEHIKRLYFAGQIYDIKLGVSCNNNCFHCVVKPIIKKIKKHYRDRVVLNSGFGMWHTEDPSFEDIVKRISGRKNIGQIVLTGGEPTIRKDFIAILKWIYYTFPHTRVSIQTNGRNLADEDLVKAILRYSNDWVGFAVAIHGMEKTHNEIVNNRKEKGNPFKETIQGIKHLISYFPNTKNIRTEIVISNKNKNELTDMIKFQHEELGVQVVGLSYPHLCGFSKKDIIKIAPPMNDLIKEFTKINNYAEKNSNLLVLTEEIPFCIYEGLGEKIHIQMFPPAGKNISMCALGGVVVDKFHLAWAKDHAKSQACLKCTINHCCYGVWKESLDINKESLIPLKKITTKAELLIKKMEEF